MCKTKPAKRLVRKAEYVQVMGRKLALVLFANMVVVIGLLGFVLIWWIGYMAHYSHGATDNTAAIALPIILGCSVTIIRCSKPLIEQAKSIEDVELMTESSEQRPLQYTLLRSSDAPRVRQQSELLRAIQSEQETPKEELLRASMRQRPRKKQRESDGNLPSP